MTMSISLLGMPVREVAALTIFVGVGIKGGTCKTVDYLPGRALPPADFCVIDMAGIGLGQWSSKAEVDLIRLLGGQSALLLLSANTVWPDKVQGHTRQRLHCLVKPYNSEDMRAALGRLGLGAPAPGRAASPPPFATRPAEPPPFVARPAAPPAAAPATASESAAAPAAASPAAAAPATVLQSAAIAQSATKAPPAAMFMRPAAPALAPAQHRHIVHAALPLHDSLHALRTMFPDLQRHRLLGRLLDMMASGRVQELRLTLHHSIVLHPAEGWVVHNVAPAMLERLVHDGSAVAAMNVRELDASQALLRASQSQYTRTALDTFLWTLAESSLGRQTPPALRDAELTLTSMPGFTRIPGVGNLPLQLAAICVRLPQTMSNLRAAFPEQDPCDISRFILLSTVSGLGSLSLVAVAAGAAARSRPAAPRPARPVRAEASGFFRAMLQKLF
jgi:hypothetical protein